MSGDTNTGEAKDNISSSTFAELTEFQRDILIVLSGDTEMKGLSVKDELDKYYESSINHGRLYPNLDTLVDKNLVNKFALDNRSNGYRLTPAAEQLLENRLAWERAKSSSTDSTDTDEIHVDAGADSDVSSSSPEQTSELDGDAPSTTNADPTSTEATGDDSILENMMGDFADDVS